MKFLDRAMKGDYLLLHTTINRSSGKGTILYYSNSLHANDHWTMEQGWRKK